MAVSHLVKRYGYEFLGAGLFIGAYFSTSYLFPNVSLLPFYYVGFYVALGFLSFLAQDLLFSVGKKTDPLIMGITTFALLVGGMVISWSGFSLMLVVSLLGGFILTGLFLALMKKNVFKEQHVNPITFKLSLAIFTLGLSFILFHFAGESFFSAFGVGYIGDWTGITLDSLDISLEATYVLLAAVMLYVVFSILNFKATQELQKDFFEDSNSLSLAKYLNLETLGQDLDEKSWMTLGVAFAKAASSSLGTASMLENQWVVRQAYRPRLAKNLATVYQSFLKEISQPVGSLLAINYLLGFLPQPGDASYERSSFKNTYFKIGAFVKGLLSFFTTDQQESGASEIGIELVNQRLESDNWPTYAAAAAAYLQCLSPYLPAAPGPRAAPTA